MEIDAVKTVKVKDTGTIIKTALETAKQVLWKGDCTNIPSQNAIKLIDEALIEIKAKDISQLSEAERHSDPLYIEGYMDGHKTSGTASLENRWP